MAAFAAVWMIDSLVMKRQRIEVNRIEDMSARHSSSEHSDRSAAWCVLQHASVRSRGAIGLFKVDRFGPCFESIVLQLQVDVERGQRC